MPTVFIKITNFGLVSMSPCSTVRIKQQKWQEIQMAVAMEIYLAPSGSSKQKPVQVKWLPCYTKFHALPLRKMALLRNRKYNMIYNDFRVELNIPLRK